MPYLGASFSRFHLIWVELQWFALIKCTSISTNWNDVSEMSFVCVCVVFVHMVEIIRHRIAIHGFTWFVQWKIKAKPCEKYCSTRQTDNRCLFQSNERPSDVWYTTVWKPSDNCLLFPKIDAYGFARIRSLLTKIWLAFPTFRTPGEKEFTER